MPFAPGSLPRSMTSCPHQVQLGCWTDTCSALNSVLEHCLSPPILRTSYVSSYSASVLFIEEIISLCAPHWGCGELLIPVFLIMVFVVLDANTHFLSTDAAFLAMEFSFFSPLLIKQWSYPRPVPCSVDFILLNVSFVRAIALVLLYSNQGSRLLCASHSK